MPKKFSSENTKAVAARERKAATKELEKKKKQQAQEDAYWEDDDKHVKKKQLRKDERDKKKQELLDKKAESKALLEKEVGSILSNVKKQPTAKVTRAQIVEENEKRQSAALAASCIKPKVDTHLTKPLIENVNRLQVDGEEARTVDEAIRVLAINDDAFKVDQHPERRLKAAYNEFESKRLPILKAENPSLRLSQLNQMIFKEWKSSPENPLNSSY